MKASVNHADAFDVREVVHNPGSNVSCRLTVGNQTIAVGCFALTGTAPHPAGDCDSYTP
ncbi:MAG: hypothetical protein II677_01095 [Muribaculaceae bacterium]|nr:hypothetical protein [Muribaculaceae bacterium]